jgi:hypothetical protein
MHPVAVERILHAYARIWKCGMTREMERWIRVRGRGQTEKRKAASDLSFFRHSAASRQHRMRSGMG